jgi:hypothetical protein
MNQLRFIGVLLAIVVIGGVALGWFVSSRQREATPPPSSSVDASSTKADADAYPDGTDLAGSGPQESRGVGDDLGRESTRALRDPAYLHSLMAQYASETDLDSRGALLAVLQSAANDEVLRFALSLADSPDPTTRQDGLALLQAYSLDVAEVRDLLTRQIADETDPAMLRQLVEMLTPAVVPTEDAAPMLEQLTHLRQHPDPDVRAASVLQSAQWDKGGDVEAFLHQAILDPVPQVRQAAIAGVTSSSARSDRLKDALLDIAGNPLSGDEERLSAIFALQSFALDRSEYAIYRQAAQANDHDDEHVSDRDDGHAHDETPENRNR